LKKYQEAAHKALRDAQHDFDRIEEDYEQQRIRFVEYHKRDPTNDELVEAHISQYRDEMEEYLERESTVFYVDEEDIEDDVDEDIDPETKDVADEVEGQSKQLKLHEAKN